MKQKPPLPMSRREFATRAACGAIAAVTPGPLAPFAGGEPVPDTQLPTGAAKLSSGSQAEAEARYGSILSEYPDRFSDAQKADLKRLCFALQPQLDSLRAWPVANSDAPALYLKPIVEREKKSNAAPNLKAAPESGKPTAPAKPALPGKP